MNSPQTFPILFWLNKSKTKDPWLPIYAGVTVNGRMAEISLVKYFPPEAWHERAHRMKGRNPEGTVLNKFWTLNLLDCSSVMKIS